MSDRSAGEIQQALDQMLTLARSLGIPEGVDPFITLSFLALPVIPEIRLLDTGLFDVTAAKYLN